MTKFFKLLLFCLLINIQIVAAQSLVVNEPIEFTQISKKLNKMEDNLKNGNYAIDAIDETSTFLYDLTNVLQTVKRENEKELKTVQKQLEALGEDPQEGVEEIFGYPGGVVLPLYDALYLQDEIKHYLVRHEQAAVHAAEGYARASGKVGVAIVTSGPGACNTITGLANAYYDGTPLILITGQVNSKLIGADAFQEADVVGITRSCCKHNYLVKDVKDLARIIKEAFYIATTGKKGPVVIDIPVDIFNAKYAAAKGPLSSVVPLPYIFPSSIVNVKGS